MMVRNVTQCVNKLYKDRRMCYCAIYYNSYAIDTVHTSRGNEDTYSYYKSYSHKQKWWFTCTYYIIVLLMTVFYMHVQAA